MATLPSGNSAAAVDRARVVPTFPDGPEPDPAPAPGTPEAAAQLPRMQAISDLWGDLRTWLFVDGHYPADLTPAQKRAVRDRVRADYDGVVGVHGDLTAQIKNAWDGKVVELLPANSGRILITLAEGETRYGYDGFRCLFYRADSGAGEANIQGEVLDYLGEWVETRRIGDVWELTRGGAPVLPPRPAEVVGAPKTYGLRLRGDAGPPVWADLGAGTTIFTGPPGGTGTGVYNLDHLAGQSGPRHKFSAYTRLTFHFRDGASTSAGAPPGKAYYETAVKHIHVADWQRMVLGTTAQPGRAMHLDENLGTTTPSAVLCWESDTSFRVLREYPGAATMERITAYY